MRIRWTPTAAADLQNIYDYLKEHEPHLARPTVIEIRKSARSNHGRNIARLHWALSVLGAREVSGFRLAGKRRSLHSASHRLGQ